MPRVKLKLPKVYHFQTKLKLRIYDLNYGAHMGNDSVLSIVHEARIQFFQSLNLKERDFYGLSLLMADSAVVYKKEGFYGDELDIKIAVSEFFTCGFELFYLVKNGDHEIARVKTGLVCYDRSENKISKLPLDFATNFS
tara:strand:+ start:8232 stop:8648 length:417 start_codon:yes stop_codon:yes gene_type:complete